MRLSHPAGIWRVVFLFLLFAIALAWVGYLWVGQQIIRALFNTENSALADRLLAGRHITPVDAYYRHADALMVHATLWLVTASVAVWLLLRHIAKLFLAGFSFMISSFLLFCVFEIFPSLIPLTHLDGFLGYYAYKTNYLPDRDLVFREKPFNRRVIQDFTGTQYSPRYGIEAQPYTIEWIMDKDGFRNERPADSADIVVLGDSYIEYGANEADTFVGRLERILGGRTVRNLGKSGYAPVQYLETLKRYGLPYRPKIAIMAFYEGNDIPETHDYLLWKSGRWAELRGYLFRFATDSLSRRYIAAAMATLVEFRKAMGALDEMFLQKLAIARGYPQRIHPDVAILNLGGKLYTKLFIDKLPETTTEQMLATDEFRAIQSAFDDFREICQANRIAPVILYVPTALQIYAPYTATGSGSQWLAVRERQISARRNVEKGIKFLAERSRVDFISLTPEFERAASRGKMIYYALDAHWNTEGREIAARFVGEFLKNNHSLS